MKNEIIIYQADQASSHIEVRIEDETVWLTQAQMATLFDQTKQNISLHINNCFKEKKLESISVVKEYLTTAKDGSPSPAWAPLLTHFFKNARQCLTNY